ncbi:MAG: 50S ribosomal protein L9 [Alphaproteobacteria bacterium]|nr:50S ribosomal protein L9 [Alphaproteobacteria bacterium]MCB9696525.1 50S ribosomal protein L9 [Alphaproteobacteria bacterium]
MRVILKSEVTNLGDAGDIVNVKPGYGRNFLIPRGLAIPATEGSIHQVEHQKRVADAIRRKNLAQAKELQARLEGTAISIRRETGEDDRLFGAVTNRDVADALSAEGIEVDRRAIQIDEPIKNIGLFTVPVRLHRDVTASVRVYVIRA